MARPPSDPPADPHRALADDSRPRGTWIDSERLLARSLGRAVRRFISQEAAGGTVLLAATVAGVALGLLTPARPLQPEGAGREAAWALRSRPTAEEARTTGFVVREEIPVAERLENALHPWTSFVAVPLFALANAGVPVSAGALGDTLTSAVGTGIILGLVVGKTLGVTAGSWLAVRLGLARLPDGVSWLQVVAVAAVAGIGFTVSLFIAGLAFEDPALRETATLAILVASALAALLGAGISSAVTTRGRRSA